MDISNITLELFSALSLVGTIATLLKFWYSMKEKLSLQTQEISFIRSSFEALKKEQEELEIEVKKNKEDNTISYQELMKHINGIEISMEKNKTEIIQHINTMSNRS